MLKIKNKEAEAENTLDQRYSIESDANQNELL